MKKRGYPGIVGRNFAGDCRAGSIVVQTPYFLKPGVFNILDEFQNISFHNLGEIQNLDMWNSLVLMSATPMVPLLGYARAAGIRFRTV